MGKELSEMTLKELWKLFPIFLTEHNDAWAKDYEEIEIFIKKLLSDYPVVRISHIGSTAVKGIRAKNIIDMLVEIPDASELHAPALVLERNGFIIMSEEPRRISLNRGYTKEGFADKVFHVHLRYRGDNDELYFRDYLNDHPEIAKDYECLKLKLWKRYETDKDAYTEAKTDFIRKYTKEARELYGNRY